MKWWYTIGFTVILGLVFIAVILVPVKAVSLDGGESVVDNYLNFMPIITKPDIFTYFDDFSNPNSGWPIGEDAHVATAYLNDEYRMVTKDAGYLYLLQAPTVARETYTVSVDARWAEDEGAGYGLVFGMDADIDNFYTFLISPEFNQYWFMRGEQDDVVILDFGEIDTGLSSGSNHIQVSLRDDIIKVVVNDVWERSWEDATINGLSYTGIAATTSHTNGISDVRYDNYLLTSPAFISAMDENDSLPTVGKNSVRIDLATIENFIFPTTE